MLQTIRNKSTGWLAMIILGLIIFTMAFFGIDSYFTPKNETFVAKIEGPARFLGWGGQSMEISQDAFRTRLDNARMQQRNSQGDAFDALAFESMENRRLLLDRMIDEEVTILAAQRDGISVSKTAVQEAILAIDAFKVDGKFSADQYRLALQSQGYTPLAFEKLVRDDLIQRAISEQISSSGFSSEQEIDAYLKLSQQTRDLRWLELPTPALPTEPVTQEQLTAWHEANALRYQQPERVSIEYVEIDASTLPQNTAIDEATLRDRYEQQRARYVTESQYLTSHILVAVPEDADDAAVSAARERAETVVTRAREEGADFAALAQELSDDVGSKAEGGDLGVVEKGIFDESFESAVFALQAGQVSEPVRGAEGWHVIKVREIIAGTSKPFEEVRDELMSEVLESEHERAFSELSGRLIDLVYKDPSALIPAAQELGLSVQVSGFFTRDQGDGVAAIEAVRRAAFSEAQKIERLVSDAIEIGPSHVLLLRVTAHEPAATLPLDVVKDRVLADFNADRLATLAKEQADALLARIHAGESLDVVAEDVGRSVQSNLATARHAESIPASVVTEAFRLAHPKEGTVPVAVARIDNDRYALVGVTAVTDGDTSALDDATRVMLRQQLAQARGSVEARVYLDALRKQYTITVAEDRL